MINSKDRSKTVMTVDDVERHYVDDKLHCDDGPAVIYPSGTVIYYKHGNLHREDGPAIMFSHGGVHYYLDSIQYTEAEFKLKRLFKV